jgi:hypothetical protein
MSGKRGQLGTKPIEVGSRYDARFLEDLDRRSMVAKQLKERLRLLMTDLGGWRDLSYQEQSLCKRAVHLERLIEIKELALASGRTIDENKYTNAICALSGLLSKLGLKKRVTVLSLTDYLQAKTNDPQRTTSTQDGTDPGPEPSPSTKETR